MNDNPETLWTYASIFEMEWVDRGGTGPHKPSEACLAAARALRYYADAIEIEAAVRALKLPDLSSNPGATS